MDESSLCKRWVDRLCEAANWQENRMLKFVNSIEYQHIIPL